MIDGSDAAPLRTRRTAPLRAFAALALAACLIAPSRADSPLDWIVSAITGQSGNRSANIEEVASSGALARGSVLQPADQIATGDGERIVLTHGHDVLELAPNTTIAIGEAGPEGMATIIKLIDGTVRVKVGKRPPGRTFSVETRYLVATVKGTQFDVTAADDAAAVSVSEGKVSVRSADASQGVDVTPGRTAVSSALDGAAPSVGPTPAGGAPAAAKAAGKSAGAKAGKAAEDNKSKGSGNSNGDGNGSGNGGESGGGNGGGNQGGGQGHNGGKNGGNNSGGQGHARGKSLTLMHRR